MKKFKRLFGMLLAIAIILPIGITAEAANASIERRNDTELLKNPEELSTQESILTPASIDSSNAYILNNKAVNRGVSANGTTSYGVYNITDSISQLSGSLTSAKQVDFYFFDVPADRSMVYGVVSSNSDISVRFCAFDKSTGTVYPTEYYAEVNKAGALNGLPADKYVLMVAYKSNYTTDAPYKLYTNYSVTYKPGTSFRDYTGDLSKVMTARDATIYINDRKICTFNERNYISAQKLYYLSPYMDGFSMGSILKDQFVNETGTVYGIDITYTSGIGQYFSEKYQFQNAVIMYLGDDNLAEARTYTAHNQYTSIQVPLSEARGSFIVYDYDTNQYVELYLASAEILKGYELQYRFVE